MATRILIFFPAGDAPGLRTEAAQLALGLAANGNEVIALGPLGVWRHVLRMARITASEYMLPGDERKLSDAIKDFSPHIIHAFGIEAAHLALPLTMLVGSGGAATLSHSDLTHINPALFRTASVIFVPCDFLREQIARRLPAIPVIPTGYLLPPVEKPTPTRNRFVAEELSISDNTPVILLADYFHGSETETALALIRATPLIAQRLPSLRVVVAGNGVRLNEVEDAALEVNEKIGYRAVVLPGYRDDISVLLTLAHIAVGSGRFAMEAIGAGVATICAGAAGMIGTYTNDVARMAAYTCYGRHGRLDPVNPRTLASEVIGLFAHGELRQRFAEEGQAFVLSQSERAIRASQITAYYRRATPSGVVNKSPQRLTVFLPDDLRELLFILPAISGLQEHFPLVHLQMVTALEHQQLLENMKLAERVLTRPGSFKEWLTIVRSLRRPRSSACLVFNNDIDATILAGLLNTSQRIGFSEAWGSFLFSDLVTSHLPMSPARSLQLTHCLGVSSSGPLSAPALPDEITEYINNYLLAAGVMKTDRLWLLCPGAKPAWNWPQAHWESLIRMLAAERPENIAVLNTMELELPENVVPIAPMQDSLQFAALLTRVELVIAPDNDALHLATLMGTPAVGIYGPTSPVTCSLPGDTLFPLCHSELSCHPCEEAVCPERQCLHELTPEEVMSAILTKVIPTVNGSSQS